MNKPVPTPDIFTQPFWDAANEKRLVIQRCQQCKRYYHPPTGACPKCLTEDLKFEPVSGRGKIESFVITHDARQPAFQERVPYVVAFVELEEQPALLMLSNITNAAPQDVRCDMPVEVDFEQIAPDRKIPQFRIASPARKGA